MSDILKNAEDMKRGSVRNPIELPPQIPKSAQMSAFDPTKYTIKIFQGSVTDQNDVLQLQSILTQGLCQTDGQILILERQTYSNEGEFYFVITYYEKRIT